MRLIRRETTDTSLLSLEELYAMYQAYNQRYFDNKLPEEIRIEWSSRLTASAGICYKFKHQSPVIRLSTWYHQKYPPEETLQTLLHEMIHLLTAGHGKEFKKYLEQIRTRGGRVELFAKERAKDPRWLYICKKCQKSFARSKRLPKNKKYVCGSCKSQLLEVLNNSFKAT